MEVRRNRWEDGAAVSFATVGVLRWNGEGKNWRLAWAGDHGDSGEIPFEVIELIYKFKIERMKR